MKVLVACECSGVVREAFKRKGHHAVSCDLQPTEIPGIHYQCDVRDLLKYDWDLIIAHPPCTYISNVSAIHYDIVKWGQKAIDRMKNREIAIQFFMQIKSTPVGKLCIENPLPGRELTTYAGKYDQIIHPYYFGEPYSKKTCLWLKGLPPLVHNPTNYASKGEFNKGKNNRTNAKWYHDLPPKDRQKIRSRTFQGIANAMAEQWG